MKNLLFVLLFFPLALLGQSSLSDAESLMNSKNFLKAEKLLTSYLNKNPNDTKAIELLGDAYGHQKKWDEAITYYGGALGMKALTISKLKALGIIGDVKKSFLKAAELDPNHIDARWALVELYMQLPGLLGGSFKKSMKYANELENLSKVDGYLAKGYIYEYDDEPELAEKFYKKAIAIGGSLTCYDKLTKLYEKQEQPLKAIANIEKSHKKHQRNAMHYQIGKVAADYNIQLEKGEKCLYLYITNYTSKDGVPVSWAYYRLAQIFKHKGDKQEALKWIDKALAEKKLKPFQKKKEEIAKM